METAAIGGGAAVAQQRGLSGMKSEDFFRILVSEMQNQDPFEPTKTADMISQVSQIRGIEQSDKLNTTLERMTAQQRTAGSSDLIGRFVHAIVEAADGSSQAVSGVVTGVEFMPDGAALLELDTGAQVRTADVVLVTTPDAAEKALADALLAQSEATAA